MSEAAVTQPPRVELQQVGVDRPGRDLPVLDGIDLCIAAGERVTLLGGNGSGKTTLARLLNGTYLPSRGRVLVEGRDTRDASTSAAVRRAVGLLFQDPDDQFVSTTVEREVAFGLENQCLPPGEMRPAVDEALRRFDLEAHRQSPPHEMSGGEKARLALACTWVVQPRCLVLDETESLLDRRGRECLARVLSALPESTAVLRITTDVEAAVATRRLLVLHAGRLVADGEPDDVFPRLPAAILRRTGTPLAWRLSRRLAAQGRSMRPTTSMDRLVAALAGAPDGNRHAPEPGGHGVAR